MPYLSRIPMHPQINANSQCFGSIKTTRFIRSRAFHGFRSMLTIRKPIRLNLDPHLAGLSLQATFMPWSSEAQFISWGLSFNELFVLFWEIAQFCVYFWLASLLRCITVYLSLSRPSSFNWSVSLSPTTISRYFRINVLVFCSTQSAGNSSSYTWFKSFVVIFNFNHGRTCWMYFSFTEDL